MPFVPRVYVSAFRKTAGHDLAEAQGHDRQVVAPQPQRRCAEEDAEGCRRSAPDQEHRPERDMHAGERAMRRRRRRRSRWRRTRHSPGRAGPAKPTTMFRPRASRMKMPAFAKPPIQTSDCWKSLNSGSRTMTGSSDPDQRPADQHGDRSMGARQLGQAGRRLSSCPLSNCLAEDPARAEDEHEDENGEHGDLGPAREAEPGPRRPR